jgi:hypothetical protein
MYHWSDVLSVPDDDPNKPHQNFLTMYGVVIMNECAAWADLYLLARCRAAQNSQMKVHCILDLITTKFKTQLMIEVEKFTIHGYMDGLTLLKLLVSKAQVNTITTVNVLRILIARLPSKMVEVSRKITDFNNHVKDIEFTSALYGQSSVKLLMSVFLAYSEVEDEDFVLHIKVKRDLWAEGKLTLTLSELLSNAENHCKTRVRQEKWKAPKKKDEEIMALNALLLNKQSLKGTEEHPKKKSFDPRQKEDKEKNHWKYIPPKAKEPTSKMMNNTMWHWCTKHQR